MTEEARTACERLRVANHLDGLARCEVVIEAIVEQWDVKRQLFQTLESLVSADAIPATNTSSLSVSAIAAACKQPDRIAGFRFFNPVPLMRVVEVIGGLLTAEPVCAALADLATRMGHTPVRASDTPGFIVNHAGRGLVTEGLQLLREAVADFATVDRIMRDAAGFRMGPFDQMDLTGLDVSHPVMESIYDQYYQEPRYRPSPIAAQRVAACILGRKTARGFYSYIDGRQTIPDEPPAPVLDVPWPDVWISSAYGELGECAAELVRRLGARIDGGTRPAQDALCLVFPRGMDATTCAIDEHLGPTRTLAIDMLFPTDRRRTLMTTPITAIHFIAGAHALFASDGKAVSIIHDSPGFIAQRMVAHVVNIGCDIAQQRVATPDDIDRTVPLGLGYPAGPLALGDTLRPARMVQILDALQDRLHDPRYHASPWLRRRAMLGVPLRTPEA